jgi:Uma2 family endonuclease
MAMLNVDPIEFASLIRERRKFGGDRYDEVWDGIYVMSPIANNEHQELASLLVIAVASGLGLEQDVRGFQGCNVSDRPGKWKRNYRVPDVAAFLPGNRAEDRETHWFGGPDFAVEILSPHDRSREKFNFYGRVGVRELMLVNRQPWTLELYRHGAEGWSLVGKSDTDTRRRLPSTVLALGFRLVPGTKRPRIEVRNGDGSHLWLA